jgi:hypothetical protein
MDGAFGRHMPILARHVSLQLLMHRLGSHPRKSQRRLELRIGLALRLNQRMNLRDKFWMLLFGLVSASSRETVCAANPGAKFVQPRVDRISSLAKDLLGSTGMPLTILDRHFGLKLSSPKPRQLPGRRLDKRLDRIRQFFHHGPVLEVSVPPAFPDATPLTRNGHFLVDHFPRAALGQLHTTEVQQDEKRFLLRDDAKGTCGTVFQAAGVALPPTVQQVAPLLIEEDDAHSATTVL